MYLNMLLTIGAIAAPITVEVIRCDEGNHISERTGAAPQMRLLQMAPMIWPISSRLK